MNRPIVALVRCPTYDPELVYEALSRGVELLGGLDRFVTAGERVLLKPNLLAGDDPESVVTTHPSVLSACARLFQKGGATVWFGDSPGLDRPARAAERAGLMEAGIGSGAEFVDFSSGSRVDNPQGELVSGFPIAQPVHGCDGIVNLPKMKTHQFTRITGAVKNLFGCIPGRRKALYHVQFQDVMAFCTLLVELNLLLRPRLHVLDGIVAMEGNGPRSGDPRPMHVLILSRDPVAVDAAFCRIIGLDPTFVPTNVIGHRRGLGHFQKADLELVGDSLESFFDPDFKIIRKPVYSNASYAHYNLIKNAVLPRPVIDPEHCIRCGRCVEACPVPGKALGFADGRSEPPRYDYDLCIRCYCCHEMCPQRAIEKKTPLLGRILQLG
ncbi:MAG: DUF362 domain-containing protein [Chloroflexota bacterium]